MGLKHSPKFDNLQCVDVFYKKCHPNSKGDTFKKEPESHWFFLSYRFFAVGDYKIVCSRKNMGISHIGIRNTICQEKGL